ncbi:flagellar brake protein [candidate division WWE3 bacterium]|uniref:Flagellar brake protein n=1 Tax=candidate division WWE3 bacterium TaxID=2053526 RepID=A0A928Y6B9_UNCKA|nr:flagellar brake protein [candidate division WWE3 bacterium]
MIGYVQGSTLIVSMPASEQLIGEPFIEGDQLNVRLITGQYAYKFTAFVDKIIKAPFKYLHLSFPKTYKAKAYASHEELNAISRQPWPKKRFRLRSATSVSAAPASLLISLWAH